MKKLVMIFLAVAAVFCAKAAATDWKYTATAAEEGYTVYVFSTAVAAEYETFADLTAGALSSAEITAKTVKGKTSYVTPQVKTVADSIPETLYAVIVSGADAKEYTYGAFSTAGMVYNPDNQETSPGFTAITGITSKGTIGGAGPDPIDTPEPTSGLLLLVGGAALALRRKQK